MKLTLCGTSAGPFTAHRACSGYVLQDGGHCIMLECGPGSLRNAMAAGINLRDVEAVVISHLHEDHYFDLGAFALQAMYGRYERLPLLVGPPGIKEIGPQIMRVYRETAQLPPLDIVEIDGPDEREIAGFTVHSAETPHSTGLHAYSRRFSSGGRNLVFSGDTTPNAALMTVLARDANLLLHECYTRDGLERYASGGSPERRERVLKRLPEVHSDLQDVARIAQDAGVERLVLTHLLPTEIEADVAKEAAAIYTGELIVGRDGMVIEL